MLNKEKIYKKTKEILLLTLVLVLSNTFISVIKNKDINISLLDGEKIYILPKDNNEIYNFINKAEKSIDITIYMLSDKDIKNKLIDKKNFGLDIRIILEKTPFGGGNINYKTYNELISYGINIKYSNPEFSLTHAKYIIVDNKEVLIMTSNLTHSGMYDDRDFAVYENDESTVKELVTLFNKDFSYEKCSTKNDNLIVSPYNSRFKIEQLIKSAGDNIKIYAENINDENILNILLDKLNKKIKVSIIVPESKKIESNSEILNKLESSGALISHLKKPYQHAKVLIIDNKVMYIGSVNFSRQSMEENREVGVITINRKNISKVIETFEKDFKIR